jgi:hypothetical protein
VRAIPGSEQDRVGRLGREIVGVAARRRSVAASSIGFLTSRPSRRPVSTQTHSAPSTEEEPANGIRLHQRHHSPARSAAATRFCRARRTLPPLPGARAGRLFAPTPPFSHRKRRVKFITGKERGRNETIIRSSNGAMCARLNPCQGNAKIVYDVSGSTVINELPANRACNLNCGGAPCF